MGAGKGYEVAMMDARNLWELLEKRVDATPDAVMAVDESGRRLTFAEYKAAAERAAAGLARHGIKGGDVLVKFGDSKITVLEDFEATLRQYKPGDKVKVTVRRGQELIEADVTLARRRAMP